MSKHLPDDDQVATVRESLVEWYETDHRTFPWRETTDTDRVPVTRHGNGRSSAPYD